MIDKIKKMFSWKMSSLTRKWLLSYILILIIPLVTNSLSQVYSYVKLKEELIQSNTNLVAQINSDLDRLFSSAQRMALDISHAKSVQELLQTDKQSQLTARDIYRVYQDITKYGEYGEITGDYFLFLPVSEYVVTRTSVMKLDEYYQSKNISMDYGMWKQMVQYGSGWQSYATSGGGEFCFINPAEGGAQTRGVVVSVVTPADLSGAVNAYADRSDIFIYDRTGGNYIPLGNVTAEHVKEGEEFTESSGAIPFRDHMTIYRKMNYTSFYLAYVIPNNVFWGQMYSVIISFVLSALICLIIGFAASYYLSRKNIKPIQQIAKLLDMQDEKESLVRDDYHFIYKAIAENIESRKDIKQQLDKQSSAMQEIQLRKLLNGQVESFYADQDSLQEQMKFRSEQFLVCILYVEDFEESLMEQAQQDSFQEIYEIMVEIISTALRDLFDGNGICYTVKENGIVTAILNFAEGCLETKEQVQDLLLEFCEEVYEKYHITLSIYAGDRQWSLNGVSASYQHALTTMEEGVLISEEIVTWYEDIRESEVTQYYYPLDKEHFMISALKEGDFAGASKIFEQIWQANFSNNTDNPYGKWIINNIVNLLTKTALDVEIKNNIQLLKELHLEQLAAGGLHPNILHDKLSNAIDKICKTSKEFDKKTDDVSLSEKISEFIMEHYQDQSLSINMLGEKFQLTPHYLSKLFKEQTGKTLLDFIHLVRLDHAKEMLAGRDKTIEEVAIQVGYTNRVTFTRAFKKYFGITPGKYLETL